MIILDSSSSVGVICDLLLMMEHGSGWDVTPTVNVMRTWFYPDRWNREEFSLPCCELSVGMGAPQVDGGPGAASS